MRILILNSGVAFNGYLFAKALEPYCDHVDFGGILNWTPYEYSISQEEILSKYVEVYPSRAIVVLNKYDVVLGSDHGVIPALHPLRGENFNFLIGVQILDYPLHVIKKGKNYKEHIKNNWEEHYIPFLKEFDFILYNQKDALDRLKKYHENSVYDFVKYPVNPIYYDKYERKPFIVYSGRSAPDKGVYHVISALSLIDRDIKLISIGGGIDYSFFASHLGVNYEHIQNCDEVDKWKYYYESLFTVCGADNPYIPTLCVLEGLSIGRSGVVFDYKESRLHYGNNVLYADPINIEDMAIKITYAYDNPELMDNLGKQGKEYCDKECLYDHWGQNTINIINKVVNNGK